jgi:type I restriction-modification system DNA methylase subunit
MIPQNFADAFERIKELVSIFSKNEERYLSPGYSEAQARLDFIDKFWIALGWDVGHENQTDPYKQEVKVERGVATNEWRKRSDYAFLSPNFRDVRFYVEAKKPHAGIDNPDFYFQTIRYGWNSHTPIAVLTDFEELRVLDCRYKPDIRTAIGRAVLKYHYNDYSDEQKFRTIYYLFSRESVIAGSIENFAAGLPKPSRKRAVRGVARDEHQNIDEAFLKELDEYREELARAFKRKNPELESEALTEVTQRTLDRLVFMRFLEDKLIETEPLIEQLHRRGNAWENFVATSRRLDRVYNGIIFKEHNLLDRPGFMADGRTFDKISQNLSHTNSPYDFNAIPIHILGSIYERFLGKVIVATDKRARVEEKPEVRKAGGVYYTPEYIVRYIVDNTVGKLIEGKTPEEIRQMRFADIACGSGSFLLGVYDTLLRYHTGYYNRNKRTQTEGRKAGCLLTETGALRLSLLQRRTILLNNIYGVDIDPQAVEVAQLSLYLKLLEDETTASAHQQQMALREALLPSLNKNIVSGNSLIAWDILEGKLFDSGEERKLNPMNFEDAFPEVMKRGGFDAIVGNPPYGAAINQDQATYLLSRYKFQEYQLDTYVLFLEKALTKLKSNGQLGFIIPNTWLVNLLSPRIRLHLFDQTEIEKIVHYRRPVFSQATVDTEVVIISNRLPTDNHQIQITVVGKNGEADVYDIPQRSWQERLGAPINIFLKPEMSSLVKKLDAFRKLHEVCLITQGAKPFQVGKGRPPQTRRIVDEKPFVSERKEDRTFRPLLRGGLIQRYETVWNNDYWISFGDWLAEPRYSARYDASEKIVVRQTGDSLLATLDSKQFVVRDSLYTIVPRASDVNLRVVLGFINSRLLNWIYQTVLNPEKGEALAQVKRGHLAQLPIAVETNERLSALIDQILDAKQQLAGVQTERDKTFYESKCATLDRQIDNLVYELYDLTPEEIGIVEGQSK